MIQRPLLPNEYKINGKILVKMRLKYNSSMEEYVLDDGKYAYILLSDNIIEDNLKKMDVFHFNYSKKKYRGFILTERTDVDVLIKKLTSKLGFAAIAGMDNVKEQFYSDVINPFMHPEKYERFKISIPNGILLYGPAGCGKTYFVEKLAEELEINYIKINYSDITSSYIHGTVNNICDIFRKARQKTPCLLFFDEIEAMLPSRNHVGSNENYKREEVNEFLIQLNNAGKNRILVIGATNSPELIDKAILRSGRFDKKIYIPAPDFLCRKSLFNMYLRDRPVDENSIDINELSKMTEGYTCSDIDFIVSEAARTTIHRNLETINQEILKEIILKNPSSLQ